jgi:hypothetical protein
MEETRRELDSLLEIPPISAPLIYAACGGGEYGQIGKAKGLAYPEPIATSEGGRLDRMVCCEWSTIWRRPNGEITVLGLDVVGHPANDIERFGGPQKPRFEKKIANLVICESFYMILRSDGTLETTGLSVRFAVTVAIVSKCFGKFDLAAVINVVNAVSVAYHCHKKAVRLEIPGSADVQLIEPHGSDGVCVLTSDGHLYGYESFSSTATWSFEDILSVASTRRRTIMLGADGRIFEIRKGKTIQVFGIEGLPVKIFGGGAHFGCVTFEGDCFCWGNGTFGQLGNGRFLSHAVPKKAELLPETKAIGGTAGEEHTVIVLVRDGDFGHIVPGMMKNQLWPRVRVTEVMRLPGFIPHEVDMKF